MDNIIPIHEGQFPVFARDLHEFLQVETRFNDWFARRATEYGFLRSIDYEVLPNSEYNPEGGRPALDFALTLSMAKELSMVERTPRGHEARRYFIECERRYKAIVARPILPTHLETAKALVTALEKQALLEAKIEADKPKVEFALAVKGADGTQTMNEVAKVLGWGEYKLFAYLRDRCILMKNNLPLQKYMTDDRPYFEVIETIIPMKKGTRIHAQTVVTAKGLIWLQRIVPPPAKHGFPGCKEHAMEAAR